MRMLYCLRDVLRVCIHAQRDTPIVFNRCG